MATAAAMASTPTVKLSVELTLQPGVPFAASPRSDVLMSVDPAQKYTQCLLHLTSAICTLVRTGLATGVTGFIRLAVSLSCGSQQA